MSEKRSAKPTKSKDEEDFYVHLERSPTGAFSPGQIVRGNIVVATRKLTHSNVPPKIHVEVKGVGSVNWSEGSGVQTKEFKASEVYVDLKVPLENKFRGDRNAEHTSAGHQRFPFEFTLPCNIPSSYDKQLSGGKGSVRYTVKGVMKRPLLKSDYAYELPFSVSVGADLTEKSSRPLRESRLEGQIKAEAWLDKCGYVPGDKVHFSAKIENHNSSAVTGTEVKFMQYTTFTEGSGKKWERSRMLWNKKLGEIPPNGTQVWNKVAIRVPQVPPSRFPFCNIIDTRYVVELAIYRGLALSKVMIPLVVPIGTATARSPIFFTLARFRHYLAKQIRQLRGTSDSNNPRSGNSNYSNRRRTV